MNTLSFSRSTGLTRLQRDGLEFYTLEADAYAA